MPANDQAVQKGMLKLGGARDAHARNAHRSQVLEDSEAGANEFDHLARGFG